MSEEQKTQEAPQQGEAAAAAKTKKVNRLGLQAINDKMKELEEKNQASSRYFKHLLQRKKELENV
ncbi:MAG TPA: hypothetical protein PK926_11515 [Spirochaetota bacterium]|nr:hypothetical protein [Spirochaetota bacterium]HPI89128.1 hypothetical protein [Spirochaetota bacterium]HPR48882.1 hypothetical protein [Spirochaetota bacterium]